MGRADYYKGGDWNGICDICGQKYKFSKLIKNWTGAMVCPRDYEPRHPQDFVRGIKDQQAAPLTRGDSPPDFVPDAEDLPLPPQIPEVDT